jgi:hypothetical protein
MDKKSFMKIALAQPKELEGRPSAIVPFADWDYYYLEEKLEWRSDDDSSMRITAPYGFVTDLASIPAIFWSVLPPAARYSYPAILHDYLYWFQPIERAAADDILKQAMHDMEVAPTTIFAIYEAVRVGGGHPWSANATARQAGERRVLKVFPTDFKTTWAEWRQKPEVFADKEP